MPIAELDPAQNDKTSALFLFKGPVARKRNDKLFAFQEKGYDYLTVSISVKKRIPRNPYGKWLSVKCFEILQKDSSQHVD